MASFKKRKAVVIDASSMDTTSTEFANIPVIDKSTEKSWVWDHVKKVLVRVIADVEKDSKIVPVDSIEIAVQCNYCELLMVYDTAYGCSSYNKHIKKSCKKYKPNADLQQKTLGGGSSKMLVDGDLRSTLTSRAWSQEGCVKAIFEFIVIDEQPFSIVEKVGLRRMLNIISPRLHVPFRRTIVREFWKMYDQEKAELMKDLRRYRVSLTTDTWTSVQNINYMVLTTHFVDDEWVMHKRILNFRTIPSHQGIEIGKLIEQCLIEWKIEKIMCISVDNASANKVAIDWLVRKMKNWRKSPLILEGKYIMVRCMAHVLNLVVKVGSSKLENSVASIRKAVRFVRSSPSRLAYFKKCVESEKIDSSGLLVMDVATRWNSTYLMLESVLKFRKVFDRMYEDENTAYKSYFNEKELVEEEEEEIVRVKVTKPKVNPPKEEDWDNAATFCAFLKVFYLVTVKVSASKYPTSHTTIHNVIAVEAEIVRLFIPEHMQSGSDMYELLMNMAVSMNNKYRKYFGSVGTSNRLFVVELVLDPRFKLRHYNHLCKKKFGHTNQQAEEECNHVKALMKKLCAEYAEVDGSQMQKDNESSSVAMCSSTFTAESEIQSAIMDDWELELQASEHVVLSDEVDSYLIDRLEANDKTSTFDILTWWKVKGKYAYPTLALVARDILAIQVSTVASESAFSTGGRVIDPFRSALTPKSVEALICYQNWLMSEDISNIEYDASQTEMEFYLEMEREHEMVSLEAECSTNNG